MKICCISDMHGQLLDIDPCDLLLIAGDICGHRYNPGSVKDMVFQSNWLDTTFRKWLDEVPAKSIVVVHGNHDFVAERMPDLIPSLKWNVLLRNSIEIEGLKIWGSPDSLPFFDWAYNVPEDKLKLEYETIPHNTNIVI